MSIFQDDHRLTIMAAGKLKRASDNIAIPRPPDAARNLVIRFYHRCRFDSRKM